MEKQGKRVVKRRQKSMEKREKRVVKRRQKSIGTKGRGRFKEEAIGHCGTE